MTKSIQQAIISLVLLIYCAGCASIVMRTGDQQGLGMVYSGIRADIKCLRICRNEASRSGGDPEAGYFVLLSLVDVPLCLIADTLCLPLDLTNLGRKSETILYGKSMFRVVKTDRNGYLHGKCSFQLCSQSAGMFWGYTKYTHGRPNGIAEAWGGGIDERTELKGNYIDGKPWEGSFLLNASDTNSFEVGPVVTYKQGVQVNVSNLTIRLLDKDSPNKSQEETRAEQAAGPNKQ